MTPRRLHRIIGVVLILPMVGWAVTGFIFFVKPGYGDAYEALTVKTYPLEGSTSILGLETQAELRLETQAELRTWLEYRVFKTILGEHLLVRTATGWQHLNPRTLQPMPEPSVDMVSGLVADAFTANPQRYGRITQVVNETVITDTGVEVTLDWNRVSLQQRGRDTDRIDRLYKVHYLQWTGNSRIDRVLGFVGLVLVLASTALGVRLAFGSR
jgi:hypothetical protein